jgi:hypothetical protein
VSCEVQRYAKDGRKRIDPPCELGHSYQAMECPSCSERLTGQLSSTEWWTWYRRRYAKGPSKATAVPQEPVVPDDGRHQESGPENPVVGVQQ